MSTDLPLNTPVEPGSNSPPAAAEAAPVPNPEAIASVEKAIADRPDTRVARAPVAIGNMGLAPTDLESAWRLAKVFAASELVPKNFRGRPEDVLVAIELGLEVGLAPMQALQSIAVINGRPTLWGDGFLALLLASPQYRNHDEYYEVTDTKTGAVARRDGVTAEDLTHPTTCAVCTFWRRDKPEPTTRRFSVAQATTAGLIGKNGKPGPWVSYPDRMLLMRARSWAGRDTFPDVLRGIRATEEAQDDDAELPAAAETRNVKRISDSEHPL